MNTEELSYAVEALLFAQAEPMDFAALRQALRRALPDEDAPEDHLGDDDAAADDAARLQAEAEAAAAQAAADDVDVAAAADDAAGEGGVDAQPDIHLDAAPAAEVPPAGAEAAAPDAALATGVLTATPTTAAHALTGAADAADAADVTDAAAAGQLAADAEQAAATQAVAQAAGEQAAQGVDEFAEGNAAATAERPDATDASAGVEADVAAAAGAVADDVAPASLEGDPNDPTLAEAMVPFALTSPVVHRPKPSSLSTQLRWAVDALKKRWQDPGNRRGMQLVEVGGGLTFRSNPRYADLLRAVREARPQRLSRPALEALAIVAYRQPVTKPEVDHLRGVDSGGSLRVLLERKLVAVVGKKEEPGRPLLYGTTADFLSHFNLADLTFLPSLREFHELNDDDAEALRDFDGLPDLASLAVEAKNFRVDEAVATDELEEAVAALQRTQGATRAALLEQGVTLADDDDDAAPASPASPRPTDGAEAPTLN